VHDPLFMVYAVKRPTPQRLIANCHWIQPVVCFNLTGPLKKRDERAIHGHPSASPDLRFAMLGRPPETEGG